MKSRVLLAIALMAIVSSVLVTSSFAKNEKYGKQRRCNKKNVIVLVPDGCSSSIQTAARWYKKHALNDDEPLALDKMGYSGMCKTYMANSVITGSAAAGTAFACGEKTTVRFLGVGPDPELEGKEFLDGFESSITPYAPIQSVLEGAKMRGKSTGLVATSRITHATPAAYACHIHDRGMDNEIMEHMVYNDVDVVFGGGARHLIPSGETYTTTFGDIWKGKRTDGENLMDELIARGYQFVDNAADMQAIASGRVWGLFDDSHMGPDIDRDDLHPTQPSIGEMTAKAIELLSQNPRGFFLMVEGSQVDWAGHANDPIHMITDHLAFDVACQAALDFARTNQNTLVLVFPDHNTGALSIGHEQGDGQVKYTQTTVDDVIAPIKDAVMTIQSVLYEFPANSVTDPNTSVAGVRDIFATYLGQWWADEENMTDAEAQEIVDIWNAKGPYSGYYPIAEYMSKTFTVFGWTTHGHTGEDVPLWTYAGKMCKRPVGLFDNTDLAKITAKELGVALRGSSHWMEFDDSILDMTDPDNPIAVIQGARFPVGKDIVIWGPWTWNLHYVTVWAPSSGKVYIPLH